MGNVRLKKTGFYFLAHFYKFGQNGLFVKRFKRRADLFVKRRKIKRRFAFLHIPRAARAHGVNTHLQ